MVRYTKFRDDRPIRSRVILGKPEGGCINPPVPARANYALCQFLKLVAYCVHYSFVFV